MSKDLFKLRTIDRLVAEKVMGWPEFSGIGFPGRCPCFRVTHNGYIEKVLRPADDGWIGASWRPSEDMATAWEVVETFPLEDVMLGPAHNATTGRWEWSVCFNNPEDIAYANTAPLAICLAALKAKGVEVPC